MRQLAIAGTEREGWLHKELSESGKKCTTRKEGLQKWKAMREGRLNKKEIVRYKLLGGDTVRQTKKRRRINRRTGKEPWAGWGKGVGCRMRERIQNEGGVAQSKLSSRAEEDEQGRGHQSGGVTQ